LWTCANDFTSIKWSDGPYFLNLTVDGHNFGNSQLLSVPYALYAEKAFETDFNFIITGLYDIEILPNQSDSIPISVHWISGDQENIVLSPHNIPDGIILNFRDSSEVPDFNTIMKIEVTQDVDPGLHVLSIKGTSESGKSRVYNFKLDAGEFLGDCGTCVHVTDDGTDITYGTPLLYCGDSYYDRLNSSPITIGGITTYWDCY